MATQEPDPERRDADIVYLKGVARATKTAHLQQIDLGTRDVVSDRGFV